MTCRKTWSGKWVASLLLGSIALFTALAVPAQGVVSLQQTEDFIRAQLGKGVTIAKVLVSLVTGGTPAATIAAGVLETKTAEVCVLPRLLIDAGMKPATAVSAVLSAAGTAQAQCVVNTANEAAPGQEDAIFQAALVAGADPTTLLPPTAAGPNGTGGTPFAGGPVNSPGAGKSSAGGTNPSPGTGGTTSPTGGTTTPTGGSTAPVGGTATPPGDGGAPTSGSTAPTGGGVTPPAVSPPSFGGSGGAGAASPS